MSEQATPAQIAALRILAAHDSLGPSAFYRLRWPSRRPRRGNNGEDTTGMIGGAVLARLVRAGLAKHDAYHNSTPTYHITDQGREALARRDGDREDGTPRFVKEGGEK